MWEPEHLPLLVLLVLAVFFWFIGRRYGEARLRRIEEEARRKHEVEADRNELLGRPIPPEIARQMREFLHSGAFAGQDASPLTYVGYRVGRTNGLPEWDRRRRLKACFMMQIPPQLLGAYQGWGEPVTSLRYDSICRHLLMLVAMRRDRESYRFAVADWEADERWFRNEFATLARRLHQYGFRG